MFSIAPLTFDITLLPPSERPATLVEPPLFSFNATSASAFGLKTSVTATNPFGQPVQPNQFVFKDQPVPSDNTLDWNWFGAFNIENLATKAEGFFLYRNGARGQLRAALLHFLRNCQKNHFRFEHQAVCLSVRIERQQDTFSVPNPHHDGHDGKYWESKLGDPAIFKLGTVLLGPGTVFYNTTDPDVHRAVSEGRQEKETGGEPETSIREWLAAVTSTVDKHYMQPGQLARWTVGNDCKGAIHSEPDMSNIPGGRIL